MVGWLVLSADGPGLWPQPPVDPPRVIYTRPAPCEDEEGQEAQAPDGPGPHEHVWVDDQYFPWFDMQAACVNVGDGSEAARYVRCGDYVEVSPGSPLDWDICGNEGCSFPGGLADNAVSVEQWDDGGAEGQFGHFEPTGFVADGYITHYKAPMQPGLVSLQNRVDDIHYAEDPATGQPVQTFDDFPPDGVWGSVTTITVWDFTISNGAPEWWRPELDLGAYFTAKIEPATDHNGQSMAGYINFSLGASSEPGYCLNRTRVSQPDPQWNDTGPDDADLKFPPDQDPNIQVSADCSWAATAEPALEASVTVRCLDYGAYGSIIAEAQTLQGIMASARLLLDDDPRTYYTYQVNGETYFRYYAPIPWDEDGNCIWDGWQWNAGNALDDEEPGGALPGDGFSRYEEYRGLTVNLGWTWLDPDADQDVFILDWEALKSPPGGPPLPGIGAGDLPSLGVAVHVIHYPEAKNIEYEPGTAYINYNCDTAHCNSQPGVYVIDQVIQHAGQCGQTDVKLDRPNPTSFIDIAKINALYQQAAPEATQMLVGHELGHACNLAHHGGATTRACVMWDVPAVGDPLHHTYCNAGNPGCRALYMLHE